ncbi:putative nuclease HARBI1 isoform X2 [Frankliniella occidentalis]|nr:putative nuclease HARBI1 isoform X2 [Frankliniella occidentalis]
MRDRQDPLDITVEAFVELYRMPQDVFLLLVDCLQPYARRCVSPRASPFHLRLLCALFYYATGSYQEHTGSNAHHLLSQAAVCNAIEEVTNALNHPTILTTFVRFPATHIERAASIEVSSRLGLPGVLGLIDGTLVPIFPPRRPNQHYYNRKRFTSLNVMIVCDTNLKILTLDARYPGSSHDAWVYQNNPIRAAMQRANQEEDRHCWLLGDSGYPLEPWLMTPLPDAPRGTPEYNYTKVHCQCRNPVERCIGVLKSRWRCLFLPIHYSPVKSGRIVNACAVLHNLMTSLRVAVPPNYHLHQDGPDPENILNPDVVVRLPPHLHREADENLAYLVQHAHWLRNQ